MRNKPATMGMVIHLDKIFIATENDGTTTSGVTIPSVLEALAFSRSKREVAAIGGSLLVAMYK
eukprot:4882181-Amphidinium_carterae.1